MLRLVVLACLLTAATAQQVFYCDSNGTDAINDRDFYLLTMRQGESTYPPGLTCNFYAESNTSVFFVEIQTFAVSTAVLNISSSGQVIFEGSKLEYFQSSFATSSKSLEVVFNATGDNSLSKGVLMRVRVFDANGCPPDWAFLYDTCFGTSVTDNRLDFVHSQKACNNMRSNLLHIPAAHNGTIRSFIKMLPRNLVSFFTWVGLTDITLAGRFRPYWLNGNKQVQTSEMSCASSGPYLTCKPSERCGTIYNFNEKYAIFMDECNAKDAFACSMPPGGTDSFYPLPNASVITTTTEPRTTKRQVSTTRLQGFTKTPEVSPSSAWIWGAVAAAVLMAALAVGAGVFYFVRSKRGNSTAGTANFVMATGSVTLSPPTKGYLGPQKHN